MPKIPDESVDLILADLPYGSSSLKWDQTIPFEKLWPEYRRIIKPNCPIVLFAREPFTSVMVMSNIKEFKYKWVWNKKQSGSFQLARYMPLQIDEDICVFSKDGKRANYYPIMVKGEYRRKGGNKVGSGVLGNFDLSKHTYGDEYYPKSILEFYNKRIKNGHPTHKPPELTEYLIRTYTRENEMVLDNTMGSGNTGIGAVRSNRNFIGIEKEEKYFLMAQNNIQKALDEISQKEEK